MELAEMCKSIRRVMKISQSKFAGLIGSNQTEVSFIERGFIPNDVTKIQKISCLYDKSINQSINQCGKG